MIFDVYNFYFDKKIMSLDKGTKTAALLLF